MSFWKTAAGLAGFGVVPGVVDWATGGKGTDYLDKKLDQATNRDPHDLQGQIREGAAEQMGYGRQDRENFNRLGQEANAERDYLRRIARGDESVSAMQLKQALGRNQAMQQSMAASARPGNAAMAARNAAANAGRQGAALAGQQALAGIQERQGAQRQLQDAILRQRGQDIGASQSAFGTGMGGLSNAYGAAMGTPTKFENLFNMGMQGGQAAAMLFSDKNLKTGIEAADEDADDFIKGLKAYAYDYKDQEHGEGRQLGVLAQDVEKTKFGKQIVRKTKDGLALSTPHLTGALAAGLARVAGRLDTIEGKK